jgi:hypothetical protein
MPRGAGRARGCASNRWVATLKPRAPHIFRPKKIFQKKVPGAVAPARRSLLVPLAYAMDM